MATYKKQWQGVVIRKAGDKSVVVETREEARHGLYGKKTKKTKRYMVHDESNEAKVGEQVVFSGSRPMSKMKRWTLVNAKSEVKKASS